MKPRAALQIPNEEDGKRDIRSDSCSRSPDKMLQGTGQLNRGVVSDTQYPLGSSSSSSHCSTDAEDELTGKRSVASTEAPPMFDVLPHFMRSRTEKQKGQDVVKESQFMSRKLEMHPTSWRPWPPSRNTYSGKDGSLHKPIRRQRSMPEEMLHLRSRGCWDFLCRRQSGRTQLRSMSFPRGHEKCADPCFSTTSFGSFTTAASSLSGTSVFSFFTRRHTDFTASLKSAELESFSAAETTVSQPKVFQGRHPIVRDQPAGYVDEPSFSKLCQPSLNAGVKAQPSRPRSHTPVDDEHSGAAIPETSESIHRSSGNFRTSASRELTSQSECGSLRTSGSGSPQRIRPSQSFSAASSEASVLFEYTGSLPYCTSNSPLSSYSHSALTPHSDVTTPLSSNRHRGIDPMQVCRDRAFTATGAVATRVESQLAAMPGLYITLEHASALAYSRISADRHAAMKKAAEGGQSGIQRALEDAYCRGTADSKQACLTGDLQPGSSQEAERCRCPNAPHLSYVSAPTSHIPELILGDAVLTPAAVAQGVPTNAKHAETVSDQEVGQLPLEPGGERLFEPVALEKVPPTRQSDVPESDLHRPVRTKYSGQLQQALSAVACRAEATSPSAEVTKHGAGGL